MDMLPTNGFIGQINLGEAVFPQRIIIDVRILEDLRSLIVKKPA